MDAVPEAGKEETIMSEYLRMPAPLRGTIHIVIPEHYGSSGVIWMSRFVTEAQLDGYKAQYPDMQIIG